MAKTFTETEASLTDVIARYEKKGAKGQFTARPDAMLECHECDEVEPAVQAPLLALHRFEGASDPSDMAALAAIECPACGAWGTIALSYGPEASAEDAALLEALLDDRDQSGIMPGT